MILGHGHHGVVQAVQAAVLEGFSYGAPTEREVELAEAILRLVPSMDMVRLVSSGTEAAMSAHPAGPRRHRPPQADQVRGLLPRPCRRPAGQGRLRPGHLRQPDQRRRAARGGAAHAGARIQQHRAARRSVRAARQGTGLRGHRTDCRKHELCPRQCGVHATLPRVVHRVWRLAGVRRGHDRLPRRTWQCPERLRQGHPRLRAGHDHHGQGHRRRHAAGGLRRQARRDGTPGTAGPGLPGRHLSGNPVATACGLATLAEISKPGFFDGLARKSRTPGRRPGAGRPRGRRAVQRR